MRKIIIKQSKVADTRTCDYSKVSEEQLWLSSKQHIADVQSLMDYIAERIHEAGLVHDHTKTSGIKQFHSDFVGGFKSTAWWDNHRKAERHHLYLEDGIPEDVNLIDVIEFLVDGVAAGLARSGTYRKEALPDGLLQKAFDNTVNKLVENIEVEK